jgi:plasmid stabilization system protein ParE
MPTIARIVVMPRAAVDIDHIFEWLRSRSPRGALAWLDALDSGFERLKTDYAAMSKAPEGELLGEELYQAFFKTSKGRTYRLIYWVDGDNVVVLRVRGPGQPPLGSDELR